MCSLNVILSQQKYDFQLQMQLCFEFSEWGSGCAVQCIFQDFEFGVNRVSRGGQHLLDNFYFHTSSYEMK